jgi:hypothetical protein
MQTDTTTIKLTEKIDGLNWQVIRYPLALYPQKAGQLEIPSIDVRFKTSAGFGSTEKAFSFQTESLQIIVESPPGVKQGELVITTTSFELDYNWQPESAGAQTGDAFTLTVTRQANDISAMLLPPLPVFSSEGLASYPQAPEIKDKTNRGDLTGERTDRIIWVVEKPGTYNIPGIRFQWWDPDKHELEQQVIPGLRLDIPPSTADKASTQASDKPGLATNDYLWLLIVVLVASITAFLWLRHTRESAGQQLETESSAFRTLQDACKSNDAAQSYAALHRWLRWVSPSVTLSDFARDSSDKQLSAELKHLQEELISSEPHWQGDKLLSALQRNRGKIMQKQIIQLKTQLAPLNP